MKSNKSFLGIGWKFPPEFDKKNKTVTLVSEEEDIKESLLILFSTRPGERMMQPSYGCNLSVISFEPANVNLVGKIEGLIQQAILFFEPRITLEDVDINTDKVIDGVVEINLSYTVIKTNRRNNIVFPYYIIEGTDVSNMPV